VVPTRCVQALNGVLQRLGYQRLPAMHVVFFSAVCSLAAGMGCHLVRLYTMSSPSRPPPSPETPPRALVPPSSFRGNARVRVCVCVL
jgi:hypothetical protein